jgi:hypothetical protein
VTSNGKNGTNGQAADAPTRREVRKIWEALGRPNAKTVCMSFWTSGCRPPEERLVVKWIERWTTLKPPEAYDPSRAEPRDLESAVEQLIEAVPAERTRALVERLCTAEELEAAKGMGEAELTRYLSRQAQLTMLLLLADIRKQRSKLIGEQSDPLAKLVLAIGRTMDMALIGYEKAIYLNERLSGIKPGEQEVLPPLPDEESAEPLLRALAVYARH